MFKLSKRAQRMEPSAIREILKIASASDVISFAGGVPSPLTFPLQEFTNGFHAVMAGESYNAFQYATTEGYLPLREWVANKHSISIESVLITTGSQQALDLIGKVLIDDESSIFVESPTYLGALQAFSIFSPKFIPVKSGFDGIKYEDISSNNSQDARFVYVMPTYQNPTGAVMPLARRQEFVYKMKSYGIPIVEDDPYRDLFFENEPPPTLHSINPDGVIYMGSFSKILAPGLRLGYVIAPPAILKKMTQAKQAADLHTATLSQCLAYKVLDSEFFNDHLNANRKLYKRQCNIMQSALSDSMPSTVEWNTPEGGMFIWLSLPSYLNANDVFHDSMAIENNLRVAFVPGNYFFPKHPQFNTMRLSFSTASEDKIHAGVHALAEIIEGNLK